MKRATSSRLAKALRRRPENCRPHLESLEERLPPGDAFLSGAVARSLGGVAAGALTGGIRPAAGASSVGSSGTVAVVVAAWRPTGAAAGTAFQVSHTSRAETGAGGAQAGPGRRRAFEFDARLLDELLGDDLDRPAAPRAHQAFPATSPDGAVQPSTLLGGGVSAGPGSSSRPEAGPVVQPVTPAHGDIVAFPPQGAVPPDQGRTSPPPASGGMLPVTPPEDDDCQCNPSGQVNGNASGSTGGYDTGREFSDGPVRYFDGTVKYLATDIQSNGFGEPWGVTRTWTNGAWANAIPGSTNGSGITISQQPFLREQDSYLIVVVNGWNYHFFEYDPTIQAYVADFFGSEFITYDSVNHDYVYTDSRGDQLKFADFGGTWPTREQGRLIDYQDPAGVHTSFSYDGFGYLNTVSRSVTIQQVTTSERFTYTYDTFMQNSGLVSGVVFQRLVSGQWSTVRQVSYVYYHDSLTPDPGDVYGLATDLRSATVKDGSGNTLDTYYYRYYTSNSLLGYAGGLKYAFDPQSYARLKAAAVAAGYGDPLTNDVPDGFVQGYADLYFEYYGTQVTKEVVQGQGCACGSGAGQGTYTFTYSTSSFNPGFNSWYYKTIETLPDHTPTHTSRNVVYANAYGQVMLKVYQEQDAGQPLMQWATFYKYDANGGQVPGGGRTILKAYPSAIDSSFNLDNQERTYPDLLDRNATGDYGYLRSNAGLIETTDYYTMNSPGISDTQAGGVGGYVEDTKVQQGTGGMAALQSFTEYYAHTSGGATVYPAADTRVYRNPTINVSDPSAEVTNYSYRWFPNSTRAEWMVVAKPGISAGENGPGASDVETTGYDLFGRPVWHRNSIHPASSQSADGYIDYTEYDQGTGAVTKMIQDADMTKTGDFFYGVPTDPFTATLWATPAGGGLHLKTTLVVDGLGRTLRRTSPSANVAVNPAGNVTYTVYNDPNHEVRTYTWDPVANVQVGPTMVYREDRQHATSYTETLTMSAPAHLTGGQPDGTEAVGFVQSLARSFTSPGGQVVERDDYFNFGGLAYTTDPVVAGAVAGTNYYATVYGYDGRGWLDRVQSPTGTIRRTVYDDLHRVVSTWVGTNDTSATPVSLGGDFNVPGITADGATFSGGLDGNSRAYSATLLHSPVTWNGLPFTLGAAGGNNAVTGMGQVISLPAGNESALSFLATGVNGGQTGQSFTVTYTDGSTQTLTQSLSDWRTPAGYAGEATAVSMTYRNRGNGTAELQPVYLYAYSFALNPAKQVQSLTLPANANVVLLAVTLTNLWTPATNTAPSNMVQVSGNVYDGGGVGDGDLTQTTQYPGGTAAPRVTQNYFDWRDRLVASKQGVQAGENDGTHRPIIYQDYDNLDEVIAREQYDGDGVTVTTTNGVPDRPAVAKRRARSTTAYDDQGRVYQTGTYNVVQSDPNAGTLLPGALVANTWYDHRGNEIKTAAPGGLVTKTVYDGADRPTVTYTTDGAGDSGWSDPPNLATNNVLEQTETTYDADGNPTLEVTRQRFHDETTTGALGNPTTAPKARVSYVASYYDAADRPTDQVDFGTYGAATFSRPAMAPPRSDTALVTSSGYRADTVQQVALGGTPSGTFSLTVSVQGMNYTAAGIAVTAAATDVQTALNGALGQHGAVQVSGPAGGPWNVRFVGSLAGMPVATMTASATGFTVSVGTTAEGGDTGRQQQVTDPRGLVGKNDFDLLGRTVRTIEAYAAFAPANGSDRTTEYSYDGAGHVLTLTARLPNNVAQTTQYVYGVSGGVISSNDLLAQVVYPANGQPNAETYTYDALGEVATKADRNGNTHAYSYDVLGRQVSDTVTVLGAGVDGTIRRLDTAYDTGDRPYLYTSYANTTGTTVVNQVKQLYNGLGQLKTEYQEHSGAASDASLNVQYAYNEMANGTNNSRLTSMTYPNGRVVNVNYASGVDDSISRPTSLQDNGAAQPLEAESYLGLGTVVQRAHPQANVNLSYVQQPGDALANHDGGDQYTGLDRFGRVIDQFWVSGTGITTDRFQYGYDRDGNRLYRANLVNHGFDELYHASGAGFGYDNFNQLTAFARGVLSASPTGGGVLDTVASPTHSQTWSLDPAGQLAAVHQRRHAADAEPQQPEPDHRAQRGDHARLRCQRQHDHGRAGRRLQLRRLEPAGAGEPDPAADGAAVRRLGPAGSGRRGHAAVLLGGVAGGRGAQRRGDAEAVRLEPGVCGRAGGAGRQRRAAAVRAAGRQLGRDGAGGARRPDVDAGGALCV